jgi:outer membrane protein
MKKVVLGLGSIFLLAGSSKAGPLIDFEASIGLIQQKPGGYVSYKAGSEEDKIDVKDDVHLGDKTKPWVKLKLEHSIPVIPNIKLAYMPMRFDGSGKIEREIRWGDYTYQADADFNLSVKLDRVDATLYYNLPFIKTATAGKLDVELGLNIIKRNIHSIKASWLWLFSKHSFSTESLFSLISLHCSQFCLHHSMRFLRTSGLGNSG